jgi:ribosomal protein S18 acetylase RimI-like enzyme
VTWYGRVEPLGRDHELEAFDCGSDEQTAWLRRHARQAHQSDTVKIYVICRKDEQRVVGYYALAAGSVAHDVAPPRVTKGIGRYPVPVVILTRLGVDLADQGVALGSALVKDALLQTAAIAERADVRALLVHAESDRAAQFYERLAIGFEPSPTHPLHLILLVKDLRAAVRAAGAIGDAATKGPE